MSDARLYTVIIPAEAKVLHVKATSEAAAALYALRQAGWTVRIAKAVEVAEAVTKGTVIHDAMPKAKPAKGME